MLTPQRARKLLIFVLVVIVPAYGYVAWTNTSRWLAGRALIARAVLTQVAITESGVEERKGMFGRTFYAPRVRYGVRTAEGIVMARQVTPLDEASTKAWATRIADLYRPGQVEPAWIDTTGTQKSYLVPELGSFFLWTMAGGVALLAVLLPLAWSARSARSTPTAGTGVRG